MSSSPLDTYIVVVVDDGNKMHGQLQIQDGKGWQVVWTCRHQHLKESSARKCAIAEQARRLPATDKRKESIEEAKAAADRDGWGDEGAGYDMAKFAAELEARGWVFTDAERDQHAARFRRMAGKRRRIKANEGETS